MNADILIVDKKIPKSQLKEIALDSYAGKLVKVVVDVEKRIMAIGGDLHADGEAYLIEHDSKQKDLWGVNLYPDKEFPDFVEFDSVINIRPRYNNRSRGIDNLDIRKKIVGIIKNLVD